MVSANAIPTVTPIIGAATVCVSSTTTLSNASPGGVWTSSNSGIASIDGSGTVTGVSAGSVTITYSVTNSSGCITSVSKPLTIIAQPTKPTITASSSTSFCSPGSVVLSSSATTGNQWYKDGVALPGAVSNSYTATSTGIYTVVATQNGCLSQESNQVSVTANATESAPTLIATGNTIICEGGSVRLHTSSLTSNKWFKNGMEIPGVTGSDYTATETGSYTVETLNPLGCVSGFSNAVLVTINPNRIVDSITGFNSVCANSSITLSNTTSGGVWTSSNTGIATIDVLGVVRGVSAGTVTISYSATNTSGCVTSVTKTVTVTAQPIQPTISVSGTTSVCVPDSLILNSSASTGNQWFKDGAAISGATSSVYNATGSGSYTLVVTRNGCSSIVSNAINVSVNAVPIVNPIVGADTVCANSTLILSSTTSGGVWNSSNTGIASIDSSGLLTGVSAGTATITYSVTNSSGCITTVTKAINVTAQPIQPTINASSTTSFCSPGSVVLNSSATIGNQWYKDGIMISGATSSSYTATDTGIYTVIATQNGCSGLSSIGVVVTANPLPIVDVIVGPDLLNNGATAQLSSTTMGGIWSSNATSIATISNSGSVTALSSGVVVLSYTVTNGSGCTTTVTKSITVVDYVLDAVDDDYSSTPFDASKNQVLGVLTNDKENNGPVNLSDVVVSIIDDGGLQGVTLDSQGRVVVPAGSPIGTYNLIYSICDRSNPNNCATATITIVLKDPCDFDDSAVGCDIIIRNAISPNNDGLNDVFIIDRIDNYSDNTVEIYNRWGQLVYSTKGYDNNSNVFRGISEGKGTIDKNAYLPSGTYYYVIKYKKPISGVTKQKVGFLYLSI
ncbi:gliding motility-associated C-terminal domain-containing protein [Flavobacterium sp. 9R]|uniref:T9SS type B sorting domain-containing protein n=1 Tax=Flavobacterium sp. 9R TaxID=2653143 RepID=UPI00351B36B5